MPSNVKAILNRATTPVWPITIAGLIVGGAIGATVVDSGTSAEATALIRVFQPVDPNQIIAGVGTSPDSLQIYVSGEIAYLSSPGFADDVAKKLDQSEPAGVTALQDGQSSVISLTSTQPDAAGAERAVNAAIDVYRQHLVNQTGARYKEALDAIGQVINSVQTQVNATNAIDRDPSATNPDGTPVTPPDNPVPGDAVARLNSLGLQRLSIEIESKRGAPMQVVQAPAIVAQAGASTPALGALGGGFVGGLAALGGALWWRKRSGVLTNRAALEAQIDNTMVPAVKLGALNESNDGYLPLARKLYAQLPDQTPGSILVLGASANSGNSYVADLFSAAAAERNTEAEAETETGGTITVVDGGSIETSPRLAQAVADADQVVIVALAGVDVQDSVQLVRQVAHHHGVPVSAVCTRGKVSSKA